ncbi:MAG TPA: phenylalanine--tRNA ligase subunit alpha [Candidatus Saccharibacteria bacterium]|nr:phenylalanine--tRNA ligase subunit alpha [Candidatus Saccharibacteria bacterium]
MKYTNTQVAAVAASLKKKLDGLDDKTAILRAPELRALYAQIPTLNEDQRASFGQEINRLKEELTDLIAKSSSVITDNVEAIDVSAPFDVNVRLEKRPRLLTSDFGSQHPITTELATITDIAYRMGLAVEQSRQLDDDYHMFTSLNFPDGHPARDDYDTFLTTDGLVAPAHTSTMQNRVLQKYKPNLDKGEPIAVLIPDRIFRNEDLDATHEHTFYQHEGVYVDKGATVGNLIATLQAFLSEYFGQELKAKIQPFYFPFTEPSFEFVVERPKVLRKNDSEDQKWLELGGCGMIHPNVLKEAGIDPKKYTGFAWGFGVERMIMMKYGIEDIRYFESGRLEFLRQFK